MTKRLKYDRLIGLLTHAGVAELADAPDLGSGVPDVQVQLLSPAPNKNESYDTIGIATFVLFLFTKTLVS